MGTYAFGDLQGCYWELLDLLDKINFDETRDQLWFAGDLVNRGPESLECLRFVKSHKAISVLGNHDLHLLAIAAGKQSAKKKDTLDDILNAPDKDDLLGWLRTQPLYHQDETLGFSLVHAGLPPQWDLELAKSCAREVEAVLQGVHVDEYFAHMYGDQPDQWSDVLTGWGRLRFITNCFTRIRYCDRKGRLLLDAKEPPGRQPDAYLPWYTHKDRRSKKAKLIFGHWATIHLGEKQNFKAANVYPLDTGCIWGGELTAMRLEDGKYFSVKSRRHSTRLMP